MHRTYASVAAVDAKQEQVLNVRRIDYKDFNEWIRKNLRPTDAFALESTGNAWYFHDLLAPLVASVTIANPIQVALIAKARVKTTPVMRLRGRDCLLRAPYPASACRPQMCENYERCWHIAIG